MSPSQEGAVPRPNLRRCRRLVAKGSTRAKAYRNALGLGQNVASGVLDVSESGARLLLTESLPTGCEIEVTFEGPGSKPVKILAVVIWAVETADGRFATGMRFQKSLDYATLLSLSRS